MAKNHRKCQNSNRAKHPRQFWTKILLRLFNAVGFVYYCTLHTQFKHRQLCRTYLKLHWQKMLFHSTGQPLSRTKQAGKHVGIQWGVVRRTRTGWRTWQISQRKGAISGAAVTELYLGNFINYYLDPVYRWGQGVHTTWHPALRGPNANASTSSNLILRVMHPMYPEP